MLEELTYYTGLGLVFLFVTVIIGGWILGGADSILPPPSNATPSSIGSAPRRVRKR